MFREPRVGTETNASISNEASAVAEPADYRIDKSCDEVSLFVFLSFPIGK